MFDWSVTKLIVKSDADGLKDVVASVQWKVVHGETVKFGTVGLRDPGALFIPYEDLTEDVVLSWGWSSVDKAAVEDSVNPAVLADSVTPAVTSKPLPWG